MEINKTRSLCGSLYSALNTFLNFESSYEIIKDININYYNELKIINNELKRINDIKSLSKKEKDRIKKELDLRKRLNHFVYLSSLYNISNNILKDVKKNINNPEDIMIFDGSKKVKINKTLIQNNDFLIACCNNLERKLNDTKNYIENSEFMISH